MRGSLATLIAVVITTAAGTNVQAETPSRTYEGVWYVSDSTDNNTGEREVEAFQSYIEDQYVTLRMRCTNGKPTFFVEWEDQVFPDQAVLSIASAMTAEVGAGERPYVFEKSTDVVQRGLRASAETSAKIVADLGQAKYASITAHLASGSRTVGIEINGTQGAWRRVSRHCPIQTLPQPAP
jgi:hypothetical protein